MAQCGTGEGRGGRAARTRRSFEVRNGAIEREGAPDLGAFLGGPISERSFGIWVRLIGWELAFFFNSLPLAVSHFLDPWL